MNAKDIILSNELAEQVCEALDLDANRVQRVIVDFMVNEIPIVYVQMIGDSRLLNVEWERGLAGVTVHVLDDKLRR